MRKRVIVILCCAIIAIGGVLTACGDEAADGGNDDTNAVDQNDSDANQSNGDNQDNGDNQNNGDNQDNDDNQNNGDNQSTESPQFCVNACDSDSDCGEGPEWECYNGGCAWAGDSADGGCEEDHQCIATYSGWRGTCSSQSDCDPVTGEVCVEYEGQGYCAVEPGDAFSCDDQEMDDIELELADDDGETVVCIDDSAQCTDDGSCQEGCDSDADCQNVDDGLDTCVDGTCECADDNSCSAVDDADICVDGVCGCSDDEICSDTQVCRSL